MGGGGGSGGKGGFECGGAQPARLELLRKLTICIGADATSIVESTASVTITSSS